MTKRIHFVTPFIHAPLHPVKVTLIGAGGNGSQMLSALARIHSSLVALGKQGLEVTVYDPDTVSTANTGRQLFAMSEVGLNKAIALVGRFNRFYGTAWKAQPRCFDAKKDPWGNIIVSCVDNVKTRLVISRLFRTRKGDNNGDEHKCWYWLDLGNAQRCGQAILGSLNVQQPKIKGIETLPLLPLPTEVLDFTSVNEKDNGPSCSLAEALHKQDLFINSNIVMPAASLLWTLLTEDAIEQRGFFINLETLTMVPLKV